MSAVGDCLLSSRDKPCPRIAAPTTCQQHVRYVSAYATKRFPSSRDAPQLFSESSDKTTTSKRPNFDATQGKCIQITAVSISFPNVYGTAPTDRKKSIWYLTTGKIVIPALPTLCGVSSLSVHSLRLPTFSDSCRSLLFARPCFVRWLRDRSPVELKANANRKTAILMRKIINLEKKKSLQHERTRHMCSTFGKREGKCHSLLIWFYMCECACVCVCVCV